MLAAHEIVHIATISTIDILAMLINVVYMVIIKQRTPKTLHSYSVILLNIAGVDFLSSLCSFMCIASVQSIDYHYVITYLGPCTLINAQWCHLFFAGHAAFVCQSVLLLTLSFAYRLWVLATTTGQKHRQRGVWSCSMLIILILGVFTMLAIYLGGTYEVPGLQSSQLISSLDLTGGIDENILPRISILSLFAIYFTCFVVIFFIRRMLFKKISNLKSADRHVQQLIFRSLTAQMLLPLAYIIGTNLWLLDAFGVLHSRPLQKAIIVLSSLFSLISPLINMYYIPSYRKYLTTLFAPKPVESPQPSDSRY